VEHVGKTMLSSDPQGAPQASTGLSSTSLTMGKIIAVSNQKGGVGKTTTAINLGASLALAEKRILLVDMDPQGNLTSGVGLKEQAADADTIYEAITADLPDTASLMGEAPILPTSVQNLFLIPANRNLAGAEIELVSMSQRETRLRKLLEQLRDRYDFIMIDTPPSLGLLTVNALVAADAVLIPLHCEYFAL
jgi:chromosome partitioning protein